MPVDLGKVRNKNNRGVTSFLGVLSCCAAHLWPLPFSFGRRAPCFICSPPPPPPNRTGGQADSRLMHFAFSFSLPPFVSPFSPLVRASVTESKPTTTTKKRKTTGDPHQRLFFYSTFARSAPSFLVSDSPGVFVPFFEGEHRPTKRCDPAFFLHSNGQFVRHEDTQAVEATDDYGRFRVDSPGRPRFFLRSIQPRYPLDSKFREHLF